MSRCSSPLIGNCCSRTTSRQLTWGLQTVLVPGPPAKASDHVPVPVGPYLNAGSAAVPLSSQFLDRFAANSGSTHAGYMSPAELRIITEWLDIGAQYFNNPFDPAAPHN